MQLGSQLGLTTGEGFRLRKHDAIKAWRIAGDRPTVLDRHRPFIDGSHCLMDTLLGVDSNGNLA